MARDRTDVASRNKEKGCGRAGFQMPLPAAVQGMKSETAFYQSEAFQPDSAAELQPGRIAAFRHSRVAYAIHAGMPRLAPSPLYTSFKRRIPEPVFYLVPALMWLALSIRHGSATLPTAANPSMEAGGLWGESKTQGMDLFGHVARRFVPKTVPVEASGETAFVTAAEAMGTAGLRFPVVAKPDRGYQGWGVRTVASEDQLKDYFAATPPGSTVLLQEKVDHPGEAGIFYMRHPGERRGRIYSMTFVYSPHVLGDGTRRLAELVGDNPVLNKSRDIFELSHASEWHCVPDRGEVVVLADTRSARIGAVYRDARHHVTRALERRIDEIAKDIPGFHFGRFDIRFGSLDRLKDGEDFRIVELNGAGAEILRIWDGRTRLLDAYRGLWNQYRTLFAIGAANRRDGCRPMSLLQMALLLRRQESLRKGYPPSS